MKKIKVGIVNYLNTAPLIYGLKKSSIIESIELIPDFPANLARDLISGKIDIGLVPVAAIPHLKEWWIIGDYCIGANGAVASVCLFSQVPLDEVELIMLDNQSRTSVALAKILVRHHWKMDVQFVDAVDGFENDISGTTAAVVIGDRALRQKQHSKYHYDLAEAWMKFTGLPFVFAAWVSNKPMDQEFVTRFNEANAYGVHNIESVVASLPNPDHFDLEEYFRKYISYTLDGEKKKGLQKFLHFLDPAITVSM